MIHKVSDVDGKPMFVMDHGTSGPVTGPDDPKKPLPDDRGCPAGTSQCLRFLKSTDALNWEYMYTLHPDPRWYKNKNGVSSGRWDHAYIQEDTKRGGFIAFPVATPSGSPAPGILRSPNGLNWTVEPPTQVNFGPVTPTSFEIGGVERMPNGRYYMIGGGRGPLQNGAYSMWTLRSNGSDVAGPYAPDAGAYRLSGQDRGATANFGQALAAWCRNYDTYPMPGSALISQYMVMPHTPDCGAQKSLSGGGHVWLLPLRAPLLDAAGHMRLSHWSGNEALKGAKLTTDTRLVVPATTMTTRGGTGTAEFAWFSGSEDWSHEVGVVVTGTLHTGSGSSSSSSATAQVGFAVKTLVVASDQGAPHDLGPDKGWDRVGNDYDCFAVNASFTARDCAAACEADPKCKAWTTIGVTNEGGGGGTGRGGTGRGGTGRGGVLDVGTSESKPPLPLVSEGSALPCQHGKPLGARYCTLKAPEPATIRRSPSAFTGLPKGSAPAPKPKPQANQTITSMMLVGVVPTENLTRECGDQRCVTQVLDLHSAQPLVPGKNPHLRDVSGAFECGKAQVCLPATTTAVAEGSHPFLFYARHGTFELYVGEPLMLVQTMTYGTYPVTKGQLGVAAAGGGSVVFDGLEAWKLSL